MSMLEENIRNLFQNDFTEEAYESIGKLTKDDEQLGQACQKIIEINKRFQLEHLKLELFDFEKLQGMTAQELEQYFESEFQTQFIQLPKKEGLRVESNEKFIYYGEQVNGLKHGVGILIKRSGAYFEGQWKNNVKHSVGIEVLKNQNIYYGEYVNGKPLGQGIFKWQSQDVYIGEWFQGQKQGVGFWKNQARECYLGEWFNGIIEGRGLHLNSNGDIYFGEMKKHLKHGDGAEIFKNRDFYQGQYANGKPNGYGQYVWNTGTVYKGNFTNGLRNGKGLWYKKIGQEIDMYQGEYVNDRKCGKGVYKWVNGTYYEGEFYDDRRNGYGEMIWVDGAYYKGEWKNGLMNGQGEFGNENGVFNGMWRDNVLQYYFQDKLTLARISLSNFPLSHSFKTLSAQSNKDHNQSFAQSHKDHNQSFDFANHNPDQPPEKKNEGGSTTNDISQHSQLFQTKPKQEESPQDQSYHSDHLRQSDHSQQKAEHPRSISHERRPNKRSPDALKLCMDKAIQTVMLKDAFTQTKLDSKPNPNNQLPAIKTSQTTKAPASHRPRVFKSVELRRNPQNASPYSQGKPLSIHTKLAMQKHQKAKKYYEQGYDINAYMQHLQRKKQKSEHIKYLNENELKIWIMKMNKMKMNPKKYEDIWNHYVNHISYNQYSQTIQRIRKHLYPPIWIPTGQVNF